MVIIERSDDLKIGIKHRSITHFYLKSGNPTVLSITTATVEHKVINPIDESGTPLNFEAVAKAIHEQYAFWTIKSNMGEVQHRPSATELR